MYEGVDWEGWIWREWGGWREDYCIKGRGYKGRACDLDN